MIEILDKDEAEFEVMGGNTGVWLRLIGSALKWIGIGVCFHLGWKIVG